MGTSVNVHCHGCQKQWRLTEGAGAIVSFHTWKKIQAIKSGEIQNERAKQLLQLGRKCVPPGDEYDDFDYYDCGAIYVCEKCKDFRWDGALYFKVNIKELPWKRLAYDVWFPFGHPRCEECNTELKFIKNIRSSKVKCPQCGGILRAKNVGFTD